MASEEMSPEDAQRRGIGGSSSSSRGSSIGSVRSPFLHPSNADAMANSVISNLDLSDDAAVSDAHERVIGSSSVLPAITEQITGQVAPPTSETTPSASNTNLPTIASSSSNDILTGSTSFQDPDISAHSRQAGTGADDSALNALMDAHSTSPPNSDPNTPNRPSRRDASFGLDPEADTHQALHGQDLVSQLVPSPLSKGGHHRTQHHHSHAPSHTTVESGAPQTTTNDLDVKTVPSVSATGVPRLWPRHASRPSSPTTLSEKREDKQTRKRRSSSSASSASSSQASAPREMQPNYAPSGSLTLAIFASGITWRRRSYLLLASLAINLGLPFLNGVMLGFGEIFARSVIAPFIGLTPGAINVNAPGAPNTGRSKPGVARVGLREATSTLDKDTLPKRQTSQSHV